MIDIARPIAWPPRLRTMALEAMRNNRLHRARAKRLIDAGIAVEMSDGRCVVKLAAQDALCLLVRSNTEVNVAPSTHITTGEKELAWQKHC